MPPTRPACLSPEASVGHLLCYFSQFEVFFFFCFLPSLSSWFFLELCIPLQVPTHAVISFLCRVGAVFFGESCPL